MGGGEGVLEGAAGTVRISDRALHGEEEVAGLLDGGVDLRPATRDGSSPADELLRAEGLDPVQGVGGPVEVECVPGVEGGLGLDQVAGEEDLVLKEIPATMSPSVWPRPRNSSTRSPRSPPSSIVSLSRKVIVGQVRPGMDSGSSKSRGIRPYSLSPVLLPALGDQVLGLLGADDDLGVERAGTRRADGVVVAEHQVAHRLAGVLAELAQPTAGRNRRGQRLEADEEVLALDGFQIGIILGGQRARTVGEHLEGLLLDVDVGTGGERLLRHAVAFDNRSVTSDYDRRY